MSNSTKPLYVKEIESGIRFQKTKKFNPEQRLDAKELRLTFADVTDLSQRPFGNLFSSLHLPVSNAQKQEYKSLFTGTGLAPLASLNKVVIIDIPKTAYGEMIDGKSIELKIPVTAGAGTNTSTVTCYSTFYGFNPDLNTQLSDQNILSSVFGVEPTSDNEFNTNIAYLFSNEIRRPLDNFTATEIMPLTYVTIPANGSAVLNFPTPWTVGNTYNSTFNVNIFGLEYEFNTGTAENPIYFPFSSIVDPNYRTGASSFRTRVNVTGARISNTINGDQTVGFLSQKYTAQSNSFWNKWEITNKYPYTQYASGKRFARLTDAESLLIDNPVGIAYLDKGIIVLTDPLLVNNIDTALMFDDANGALPDGTAYAGLATEYTGAYFPDITKASLTLKSMSTEYIQSYTCLALQDEFYDTDNPTFRLAYPQGNTENENVYVTEVGLYNASGELIAIAKTSKPVAKNKINVAVFRLSIKI